MIHCNYCTLRNIKRRAKKLNIKVTIIKNSAVGGCDVYTHLRTINIEKLEIEQRKRYFMAWLMKVTSHCVC